MRKLTLSIILPVFLLICAPSARAQEDERPKFTMPCQQVLQLGMDKFMDVYGETTKDYSTYGTKQAFAYYVDCKRVDNDTQAKPLAEERRQQIDEAREALQKLGNAGWSMRYIIEGGGTLWGLASVGAYAERETYMATIIAACKKAEKPQPLLRRRANASVRRAQSLLARHARTPKLEFFGPDELSNQRKHYQDSVKEARAASTSLQALIAALPDAAAERVAKRMADELDAALSK